MCVAMRSGDGIGHLDWARMASVSESKVADEFDDSSRRFERIMRRFQELPPWTYQLRVQS